jgi:hypothetical protein
VHAEGNCGWADWMYLSQNPGATEVPAALCLSGSW